MLSILDLFNSLVTCCVLELSKWNCKGNCFIFYCVMLGYVKSNVIFFGG